MNFNEQDVRAYYRFLGHKKETEIRLIDPHKKQQPKSFFVHDEHAFVEVCKKYNEKYNVYAGINERVEHGTKMEDVVQATVFPIDIDPVRGNGIKDDAATEEELLETKNVADIIYNEMILDGYTQPLVVMSGNGYQLLWKIQSSEFTAIEERKMFSNGVNTFIDRHKKKYFI